MTQDDKDQQKWKMLLGSLFYLFILMIIALLSAGLIAILAKWNS